MNCCSNTPTSPRGLLDSTQIDFPVDYEYNVSQESFDRLNEEERQEEQLLDALSIVESRPSMQETKRGSRLSHEDKTVNSRKSQEEVIVVETEGLHTASSIISKDTEYTEESTDCACENSTRQCHGVETNTEHARINFFKSPSHMKEDVEMELKIPSNVMSHRTGSFHTGTEASSIGSMSTATHDEQQFDHSSKEHNTHQFRTSSSSNQNDAAEVRLLLKETKEQLRVAHGEWRLTQRELRDNKQELANAQEKAQILKQELRNFNKEWECQQTLLRNKDKELERLRLIIADRTLQLTEKTGELSITKVAFMASENGLSACRKQLCDRMEELEKAHLEIQELRKQLSDSKVELSRTKLQLEAFAQRRKQFSNRAMKLLLGESESTGDKDPSQKASTMKEDKATGTNSDSDSTKTKATSTISLTRREQSPMTDKSWAFTTSGSASIDAGEEAILANCPLPFSFSSGTVPSVKKEVGVQTMPHRNSEQQPAAGSPSRGRDGPLPIPKRGRSNSRGGDENSVGAPEKITSGGNNENVEAGSVNSLYFDATSKALSLDAIIANTTKGTNTDEIESGFFSFDSMSKTPSASGSARKHHFTNSSSNECHPSSITESNESCSYITTYSPGAEKAASQTVADEINHSHRRANSLVESRSIEITESAVSHLTDDVTIISADSIHASQPQVQSSEDEGSLAQKGKKWKALLKKMKEAGEEKISETESITLSNCSSSYGRAGKEKSHAPQSHFLKNILKTIVTGTTLVAFVVVFSVAFVLMTSGVGVSYRGGVLNLSDSRIIVSGVSIVLLLALHALWSMVEQMLTRAFLS